MISHLKIGPYESPLIRHGTADVLLCFDEDEAYRSLAFVRPGGLCFVSSPKSGFRDAGVRAYLDRSDIVAHAFVADKIAMELGSPRSANLALVGYAVSMPEMPFGYEEIKATIERITPSRFREVNLKAFEAGYRGKE